MEHPGASSGYHSTSDRLLVLPLTCQPCCRGLSASLPGNSFAEGALQGYVRNNLLHLLHLRVQFGTQPALLYTARV